MKLKKENKDTVTIVHIDIDCIGNNCISNNDSNNNNNKISFNGHCDNNKQVERRESFFYDS